MNETLISTWISHCLKVVCLMIFTTIPQTPHLGPIQYQTFKMKYLHFWNIHNYNDVLLGRITVIRT